MQATEVAASELFKGLRWKVEIFTDDNSLNLASKWPSVPLGDIAEESTKAVEPKDYEEQEFFYVGLENVEPLTGDAVGLVKCKKSGVKSRSKVFSEGFVLYGRLRPYLRKVFLADSKYSKGLCSTEFIVLKPDPQKIFPAVLRALLASEAIAKQLSRFQTGAALPRVSSRDFLRTAIPLPPIDIQLNLVTKLQSLNDERARLKARLQQMPTEVDNLIRSVVFAPARTREHRD